MISIHAPREGCDLDWPDIDLIMKMIISIHAPREGCDLQQLPQYSTAFLFQSTHPARGATPLYLVQYKYHHHFNPRTPRGVRLIAKGEAHDQNDFNPRTPRGVRQVSFSFAQIFLYFNPRTPRGVRQEGCATPVDALKISIHAPREGCDRGQSGSLHTCRKISIHAPREGCDQV